jgi:hypothetical protein
LAKGSGHFIQEDRPDQVIAAIEAVLEATGADFQQCAVANDMRDLPPATAGGDVRGR